MSQEMFAGLVDAHYAPLYRFALSLARSGADASDLVQQTFFIWATKGDGLRESGAAKSWLFTTLYREFLRGRRRRARTESWDALNPGEAEVTAEDADRASQCDAATVVAALQEVDEAFRAPLTLFYLEDLSYQEIAKALDIPIGTVMSRISRGKCQIRSRLAATGTAAEPGRSRVIPFKTAQGGPQS
ncbi:MAG: RNA polymerase sigma factor [Opitutaceae bacterium]